MWPQYESIKVKTGQWLNGGSYSHVYLNELNLDTVIVYSNCYAKEVLALGEGPKGTLWPKIQRIGYEKHKSVYIMPKYVQYKHDMYQCLNEKDKELVNTLYALKQAFRPAKLKPKAAHKVFELLANEMLEPNIAKELIHYYSAINQYADFVDLDISSRNLALDDADNLVLLDIFLAQKDYTL